MKPYTIAIALMGKGATNHLHRRDVVEAFRARGVKVRYLIRPDYFDLLTKIPDCEYSVCKIKNNGSEFWIGLFRYIRGLYPSCDIGKIEKFESQNAGRRWFSKIAHWIFFFMARYRLVMRFVLAIEGLFYRSITVDGVEPSQIDQLLSLGAGASGAPMEGELTWWARGHGIPVVHLVGNYDNLSTKGFLGAYIDKLLVWGPNMRKDAIELQGIADEKIVETGSIRYNGIEKMIRQDKQTFFSSIGLNPEIKTILFAGSLDEFHYYEMTQIFKLLNSKSAAYQLIMRIYPNKRLMNSPYMEPLIDHLRRIPGVFVSMADPHYKSGARDREVLQIEEDELWHSLKYSDLVINLYSTIALEACIFDKPVINIWYFKQGSRLELSPAAYWDYSAMFHSRRLVSYGAIQKASNRDELIRLIDEAMTDPEKYEKQREVTVNLEAGRIDGLAVERVTQACLDSFVDSRK